MNATQAPFDQYVDLNGRPLDGGYLYFGEANENPETSPITVYWDAAGTQPAAQPVRTLNGYIVRNGSPANIYVETDYSLTVKNSYGQQVYYVPTSADSGLGVVFSQIANCVKKTGNETIAGEKTFSDDAAFQAEISQGETSARTWSVATRSALTAYPVPTFRPKTANTVIAFDIMPKGTPTESAGNGYAWIDVCDSDVRDNNNAVRAARVGMTSTGAQYGPVWFDGATGVNGELIYGAGNVVARWNSTGIAVGSAAPLGKFDANNGTVHNVLHCVASEGTVGTTTAHPLVFYAGGSPRTFIPSDGSYYASYTDNTRALGTSGFRWTTVYATTGSINTSDEREKQNIGDIPDEWLDTWGDVKHVAFRWIASVQEKGDEARWHVGHIAQQVRDAFAARGLDATKIGLLCYDKWDDEWVEWGDEFEDVLDEDGNLVFDSDGVALKKLKRPAGRQLRLAAGDRWGIRPDQCMFMEAAYMRRELRKLQEAIGSNT